MEVIMKFRILIVSMIIGLLIACSSSTTNVSKDYSNSNPSLNGAPKWVLQPSAEGSIAAVGSAEKSPGGINFQRTEAMSNARNELSRIIETKVKNLFTNFERSTGVGKDISFDKVTENVTKQVVSQSLSGSEQKDIWISGEGTMFVLVSLDSKHVQELVKANFRSSLRDEKSLYRIEESKDALKRLDEEVGKEFK